MRLLARSLMPHAWLRGEFDLASFELTSEHAELEAQKAFEVYVYVCMCMYVYACGAGGSEGVRGGAAPTIRLTSHLSRLTPHLSPLTSHLSPLTPDPSPLTSQTLTQVRWAGCSTPPAHWLQQLLWVGAWVPYWMRLVLMVPLYGLAACMLAGASLVHVHVHVHVYTH